MYLSAERVTDNQVKIVQHYKKNYLPLMKKVTLSSESHSAKRRGCTLVVNLNAGFSLVNTTPAGTEALKGEIILHIPNRVAQMR